MLEITATGTVAALTFVLATLLVWANRKFHVEEDPRIDMVEEMLPATNCGGCGYPGCRPFAEALVNGETLPGKCNVSSEEGRTRIAEFLGVDVGAEERQVARLACAGGTNVARNRAHYDGMSSCRAAERVAGGGKSCFWGCLGHGDCFDVCDFDAIHMDEHGLPVVDEDRCTACGDCVAALPEGPVLAPPDQPPTVDRLLLTGSMAMKSSNSVKSPAPRCARCAAWMHPITDHRCPSETCQIIDYSNRITTTPP